MFLVQKKKIKKLVSWLVHFYFLLDYISEAEISYFHLNEGVELVLKHMYLCVHSSAGDE